MIGYAGRRNGFEKEWGLEVLQIHGIQPAMRLLEMVERHHVVRVNPLIDDQKYADEQIEVGAMLKAAILLLEQTGAAVERFEGLRKKGEPIGEKYNIDQDGKCIDLDHGGGRWPIPAVKPV